MNIIIAGPGEHGKDTAAEIISQLYGLTYQASSQFMARHVHIVLQAEGIRYDSPDQAHRDRRNHRERWARIIHNYCQPDLTRLARGLFAEFDMYVGIRNREEFFAVQKFADLSVYVDAHQRLPNHDKTCEVFPTDCDAVICNNGSKDDLTRNITRLLSGRHHAAARD